MTAMQVYRDDGPLAARSAARPAASRIEETALAFLGASCSALAAALAAGPAVRSARSPRPRSSPSLLVAAGSQRPHAGRVRLARAAAPAGLEYAFLIRLTVLARPRRDAALLRAPVRARLPPLRHRLPPAPPARAAAGLAAGGRRRLGGPRAGRLRAGARRRARAGPARRRDRARRALPHGDRASAGSATRAPSAPSRSTTRTRRCRTREGPRARRRPGPAAAAAHRRSAQDAAARGGRARRSSTSRWPTCARSASRTSSIVTGFAAERIEERAPELERRHGVRLELVRNDRPEWNNAYSLWVARERLRATARCS